MLENELKVWWKSKTILFILVSLVAGALAKTGWLVALAPEDVAVIVDLILNGTVYVSGAAAIISRYVAKTKVTLTAPAAPVVSE